MWKMSDLNDDVWSSIVNQLSRTTSAGPLVDAARLPSIAKRLPRYYGKKLAMTRDPLRSLPFVMRKVCILDRPTLRTAVIYYSDAKQCHYENQLWRMGVARCNGSCALSGREIVPGNSVFRPMRGESPPCNYNEMILASVISASVEEE